MCETFLTKFCQSDCYIYNVNMVVKCSKNIKSYLISLYNRRKALLLLHLLISSIQKANDKKDISSFFATPYTTMRSNKYRAGNDDSP